MDYTKITPAALEVVRIARQQATDILSWRDLPVIKRDAQVLVQAERVLDTAITDLATFVDWNAPVIDSIRAMFEFAHTVVTPDESREIAEDVWFDLVSEEV